MTLTTVLVVLAALATGAGVGWWIRRSAATEGADEARMRALEDKIAELKRERDAAGTKPATLEPAPAPVPTPSPGAPGGPAATPGAPPPTTAKVILPEDVAPDAPPPPGPPKYLIAGQEEALKAVDWNVVGKNMAQLVPEISKFASEWASTGKLPTHLLGHVQELNGGLVTAAIKAQTKMGLTNPNAAFTHPAFMVNAIAATLEAAGKPLTDEQGKGLASLGGLFTERAKARAGTYDADTFTLAKTIDDAALRDEFFAAVADRLTPEQRDALWPAESKGRLQADLFSSGLLWSTVTQAFAFKGGRDALIQRGEEA